MAEPSETWSLAIRESAPAVVAAAVSVVAGLTVIVVLGATRGIDPEVLLRDPVAQFGLPVYAGFISYFGVLLLCATAAMTAFVAAVIREATSLFAFIAAFSALLALDDLYLLHELVGPRYLGIPQKAFLALYAVLGLVALRLLVGHVGIRRSAGLVVALGCLGMSALVDLAVPGSAGFGAGRVTLRQVVLEDLFKLAGWAAWFAFWTSLGRRHVSDRLRPGS
jgi:hypothetical protein